MSSAPSLLTPAPQIRRVSRRHCALYKLNLLIYLLTALEEDHHRVIAATLKLPAEWRRPVDRRRTWLRTIDDDFSPWTSGSTRLAGRQEMGTLVRQRCTLEFANKEERLLPSAPTANWSAHCRQRPAFASQLRAWSQYLVYIDADLFMRTHVLRTAGRCFAILRQIRSTRRD